MPRIVDKKMEKAMIAYEASFMTKNSSPPEAGFVLDPKLASSRNIIETSIY